MSTELGRQRTCDVCGKTVFKKYLGQASFYDLEGIIYDDNYDNKEDSEWKYLDDVGDLCPDCVERILNALNIFKKKEENLVQNDENCKDK